MTQQSILIIDDNQDLADGFNVILSSNGFKVDVAYTGNEGIASYQRNDPDMVLLDIKLPDINGVEVFRRLHKINRSVKVIIMTGYGIEQILEQVIDSGSVQVLRRPFAIEQIFDSFAQKQDENLILISDDDPFFAGTLSSYFEEYGMTSLLAHNYEDALEGIVEKPIEILLLDLHVPLMFALEVYLNLKRQNKIIKTIIVTGNVNNDEPGQDPLRSSSVTGCLFKPFTPEHLILAINSTLAT